MNYYYYSKYNFKYVNDCCRERERERERELDVGRYIRIMRFIYKFLAASGSPLNIKITPIQYCPINSPSEY